MSVADRCDLCGGGRCRPDLVWFGEEVRFLEEIEEATARADLFVCVGTSGTVYPAAGLMETARRRGARTLEINLEPSGTSRDADRLLLGRATETVPAWVEQVLTSGRG
jgi:NAD-dependent deacetylase